MKDVPSVTGRREEEVVLMCVGSRPDWLIKTVEVSVKIPR